MPLLLQKLTDFFLLIFSRGKLKRTLFVTFSLLLAIVFSVSWFFTARGLHDISDASLQDLAERSSQLVFEKFKSYLNTNIALLETNSILFDLSSGLHSDSVLELFKKELEFFPALHIISAGFADGEYLEVQRMEDGSIRYGRAGKETGGALLWFRYAPDRSKVELDRRANYDPRTRPWYQKALSAGTLTFSEPYHLVSTGNRVIAASMPLYAESGKVWGVTTIDILLDDIIQAVHTLAEEFHGYVLIRDHEGNIIINAHGGEPAFYSFTPDITNNAKTVTMSGIPYRFLTLKYEDRIKTSWLITIALPETAFRTYLYTALSHLSLVYSLTLVLFFMLVYGIVTAVDTPIRQFTTLVSRISHEAQDSVEISEEEAALLTTIAKRKTELGSLARSFQSLLLELQSTVLSLKQSLLDKDILLKEVHHRVKNNLQIIASLLHLEADNLKDEHIKAILFGLEEKVYAMAMVHEMVYSNETFSAVSMADYLYRLAESLESYHSLTIPVYLSVDADDVQLPLDRAITCALIIVELVTNAFKYAFREKTEGHIHIILMSQEGIYKLVVQDDGSGFERKDAVSLQDGSGTGSIIMQALTSQIKGSLHRDTGPNGTRVEIDFPMT